jgi:hypothetical protein
MRTVLFLIVLVAFLTSTAAFFRNPKERHHDQMEREGTGVQKPHIWGHLEGRTFEEARDEIKRDRPDAVIHRVPMVSSLPLVAYYFGRNTH